MADENQNLKTKYQYIRFQEIISTGKTRKFQCLNNNSGEELGIIKWYGAWRQYCYFPSCPAVYSTGCLNDITDFIKQLK